MARRLTGLPKTVRRARGVTYGAPRWLGNVQPYFDFFATGRVDRLAMDVGRRYVRRKAGGMFSRAQFGNGSIWRGLLGMILGRAVGKIGRW